MSTLLLDVSLWDLVADSAGNIAVAAEPYALAQDVASALRTVLGEVWFDDTLGIPYLVEGNPRAQILGETPPLTVFKAYMVNAALTVPGVVSAQCIVESFDPATRQVVGQVQFIDSTGQSQSVAL